MISEELSLLSFPGDSGCWAPLCSSLSSPTVSLNLLLQAPRKCLKLLLSTQCGVISSNAANMGHILTAFYTKLDFLNNSRFWPQSTTPIIWSDVYLKFINATWATAVASVSLWGVILMLHKEVRGNTQPGMVRSHQRSSPSISSAANLKTQLQNSLEI